MIEVGAFAGDLSRVLVGWAAESEARVWAIDPSPQDALVELDRDRPQRRTVGAGQFDDHLQ